MIIRTINVENPFIPDNNVIKTVTNDNNIQFSSLLKDALNKVNSLQLQSDEYKQLLATGDVDNLHDVTIAAEKQVLPYSLLLLLETK